MEPIARVIAATTVIARVVSGLELMCPPAGLHDASAVCPRR
jgi:hypothetical protein